MNTMINLALAGANLQFVPDNQEFNAQLAKPCRQRKLFLQYFSNYKRLFKFYL